MSLRVLVCGGREFKNRSFLFATLDKFHADTPFDCVIHGAARGADTLAGDWAKERGVQLVVFPADWKRHGRIAGPLRNRQMLIHGKPDVVIAFAGGTGTADMIAQARRARVPVEEPSSAK
jgi:hypothetical protein